MTEDLAKSNNSMQSSKAEEEQKNCSVIKADPSRKRITAGRRRAPNDERKY